MLLKADMTRFAREQPTAHAVCCEERQRLAEALLAAVHRLTGLLGDQSAAIIGNEPNSERFDSPIHLAQRAKNEAKLALMSHIEQHRCE